MGPRAQSAEKTVDTRLAYEKSLEYKLPDSVFLGEKMRHFLKAKGVQFAVQPQMMLPSLLAATSNAMNMAELKFGPNWYVSTNLYVVLVANKGSGKTPSAKVFFGPLASMEELEIKNHGKKPRRRKKSNRDQRKRFRQTFDEPEAAGDDGHESEEDDSDDAGSGEDEAFKFNPKTRLVEGVTPEALIMCLNATPVLVIKADEFKGYYDKFIESTNNQSAFCSMYSGEDVKYTTVKRGSINIPKTRLSIYGAIQPGPLGDIINGGSDGKKDDQGQWDRFVIIPASEDPDVDFVDQLKPLDPAVDLDIQKFLTIINKSHKEPTTYTVSEAGMDKFVEYKRALKEMDRKANMGNEVCGMTSKLFTNLQKVATIAACAREALTIIDSEAVDTGFSYIVTPQDVESAWEIMGLSMNTYKKFKPAISIELGELIPEDEQPQGLLSGEQITDEILFVGAPKLKKIYDKSRNGEILLSILKRDCLYPRIKGVNEEVFAEAMVKFGVATKEEILMKNRKTASSLKLVTETEDEDVKRLYQLLYQRLRATSVIFDPLGVFHEEMEN